MSNEITLLPCPFCGGEAHISDDYSSKRGMVYSVWHDCPAGGDYHPYGQGVGVLQVTSAWFSSREEAIAAWNTRATLGVQTASVAEKIEELRGTALKFPPNIRRKVNIALNGIEQAIAATLGSGALAIEQIKDAVLKNFHYDRLKPPLFDWQAIADELNAELGSGTCEMEQLIRDMHRECTACGYSCRADNGECGIIQRIRKLGIEVDA